MALKSEADLQALFAQGWFCEISHLLRVSMSGEDLSFLLTALEWLQNLAMHALCDCQSCLIAECNMLVSKAAGGNGFGKYVGTILHGNNVLRLSWETCRCSNRATV